MSAYTRFETHLLPLEDIELILLKGHLLLEEQMDLLLEACMEDYDLFRKMNLSFDRKIKLLYCLPALPLETGIFSLSTISELNRIRNKLAHRVDFKSHHDDLKKWACNFLGYTPKTINRKKTFKNTLVRALGLLIGCFAGMAEAKREINNINKNPSIPQT